MAYVCEPESAIAARTSADDSWLNYETCVYRGGQYASNYGPCDPATRRVQMLFVLRWFMKRGDPVACTIVKLLANRRHKIA